MRIILTMNKISMNNNFDVQVHRSFFDFVESYLDISICMWVIHILHLFNNIVAKKQVTIA